LCNTSSRSCCDPSSARHQQGKHRLPGGRARIGPHPPRGGFERASNITPRYAPSILLVRRASMPAPQRPARTTGAMLNARWGCPAPRRAPFLRRLSAGGLRALHAGLWRVLVRPSPPALGGLPPNSASGTLDTTAKADTPTRAMFEMAPGWRSALRSRRTHFPHIYRGRGSGRRAQMPSVQRLSTYHWAAVRENLATPWLHGVSVTKKACGITSQAFVFIGGPSGI
jgi:hypothetical protein